MRDANEIQKTLRKLTYYIGGVFACGIFEFIFKTRDNADLIDLAADGYPLPHDFNNVLVKLLNF